MLSKKTALLFFSICIALFAVAGVSGCKVVEKIDNLNGILEAPPPDPEVGTLLQAELAFFEGDYALARDLYNDVESTTEKPIHRNHALYGLAAVGIATADNTNELAEAIGMLKEWQEPGPDHQGFVENPRLLAVALNSRPELFECKPEIRYVTTKKEGELLRKHQEEIVHLKATIDKLEHQISVLEAIDQEIQEKRKPI